jgi:hypothetical protein
MRCIKLFLVCILIFQCKSFSQENLKDFSIKDSSSILIPINKNDFILGLELNSKAINDTAVLLYVNSFDLNNYSKEDLKSFKASFSLLM